MGFGRGGLPAFAFFAALAVLAGAVVFALASLQQQKPAGFEQAQALQADISAGDGRVNTKLPNAFSATPRPASSAEPAGKWDGLYEEIAPAAGVTLPAKWGDAGPKLVSSGALNYSLFAASMKRSGRPLLKEQEKILLEGSEDNITISRENRLFVLNVLWALGLANKNPVLTHGPLSNTPSVAIGQFASTGGWSLGSRDSVELVSSSGIVSLTQEQQKLVERVAKETYRPCCDNPTFFPDCNHGMAALGLAELLASQNASEEQILAAVLYANSYWFPQAYADIAEHFKENGIAWKDVGPGVALAANYSSASGHSRILRQLKEKPALTPEASGC
jgi:hypothetical protein